jgi:hypothetical protein
VDGLQGGHRRLWIFGAGVVLVLLLVGMMLAPSAYEVADKGRDLRPYESGVIYKIELADSVTVYAAEESQPDTDAISGSLLVALATMALMTSLLLKAVGGSPRLRTFYALTAGGFAFLSIDEFFAIHETVGHNLLFLSDIPGIERPDDLLFALYMVPALVFLYVFRDVLLGSKRAIRFFAAGLLVFGLAAASDVAGVGSDEPLEVVSAALIAGGFVSLAVGHLSAALARRTERDLLLPRERVADPVA